MKLGVDVPLKLSEEPIGVVSNRQYWRDETPPV
jgi:hypothetical protein